MLNDSTLTPEQSSIYLDHPQHRIPLEPFMKAIIIVVEDEGLIAFDLKMRLEQVGYIVAAIADNAIDALVSVERFQPSLVLMDIRLRGPVDGIETADQIRQRFHVPFMFVTAHADRETLDRARITEPCGYIVKPFHSVDLRALIEMALWKHQMEQERRRAAIASRARQFASVRKPD